MLHTQKQSGENATDHFESSPGRGPPDECSSTQQEHAEFSLEAKEGFILSSDQDDVTVGAAEQPSGPRSQGQAVALLGRRHLELPCAQRFLTGAERFPPERLWSEAVPVTPQHVAPYEQVYLD